MNTVITVIDENPHYWNLLLAFLASVEKNSPNIKITVFLMNLSVEKQHSLAKFESVQVTSNDRISGSASQKNYYRHDFMSSCLTKCGPTAWIDPDCLVRRPIDSLFDGIKPRSIKYWHKHGKKERHQFQGGVYVLGSSKNTIGYCNEIYKQLQGTDDWMLPQTLMLRNIKKFKLKPIMLPESYNDSKFKKDSFIWHCKHSHFADAVWQKEYLKYLKIGKEIVGE